MADPIRQIKFHQDAKFYGKQKVDEFAIELANEARLAAHRRRDKWVLNSHIDEALANIREKQFRRNTRQQILTVLGGVLFGAFFSGFITEISANRNPIALTFYVFLGIAGVSIGLWGYLTH